MLITCHLKIISGLQKKCNKTFQIFFIQNPQHLSLITTDTILLIHYYYLTYRVLNITSCPTNAPFFGLEVNTGYHTTLNRYALSISFSPGQFQSLALFYMSQHFRRALATYFVDGSLI